MAALLVGATSGALAAAGGGTIKVCVHKSGGGLYKARRCAKHDKKLSWNVQGQQGPRGIPGPPGPATGSAGGALTGNYPNPGLGAGAVGTEQFGTIPAARVTNSTPESTTSGVTTTVTFDTNVYDNDSIHSTTTNTARLTAPVSGVYEITGQIHWPAGGGTIRYAQILENGSTQAGLESESPLSGIDTYQQVTTQTELSAGDYVELVAYQDSGSTLSILPNTSWLAIHWLGP